MFDPGLARRLAGTLFLRADTQRDERAEERARPVEDFLRNLRGWLPAARATRRQVARLVRLVDAAAAPLAALDDAAVAARFHAAVALLRIGRGDRADLAALPTVLACKELVFDYLKDRVAAGGRASRAQLRIRAHIGPRAETGLLLRGLHFAIVDEADSILIDEARTPLILAEKGDSAGDPQVYHQALQLAGTLERGRDFELLSARRQLHLTDAGRAALAMHSAPTSAPPGPQPTGVNTW
jgi:hypothetical protein